MSKNILLIVEGNRTEKEIFEKAFEKIGYNIIQPEEKLTIDFDTSIEVIRSKYSKDKDNIVIIEGPRNRIHDFLKYYDENTMSLDRIFSDSPNYFSSTFLIYDVDHNDNEDVEEMFRRFQDETTGMLLLSSPCIEVLGDYNRNREKGKYNHLGEYKKDLNDFYNGQTVALIQKNLYKDLLYFLEKNYQEFNEPNIMEHPSLIVKKINELNERVNYPKEEKEKSYVIYRYFSTVVYVAIAHACGLTREIENYEIVRQFFLEKAGDEK